MAFLSDVYAAILAAARRVFSGLCLVWTHRVYG